jgi:hypothetical protein
MRRAFGLLVALVFVGAVVVQSSAAHSRGHDHGGGKNVLRFDSMAPVVEPFTGTAHPVRGLAGGGLPWQISRASGRLRSDGRLKLKVRGLVLARRAPVPAAVQGTNPIPQFKAIVNCLTAAEPADGVSVASDPVPASPQGNARFKTKLALPHPCIAPIVFVTSPTDAWFAATGF